jgi:Kef-type K+ transport system membrane component KefB
MLSTHFDMPFKEPVLVFGLLLLLMLVSQMVFQKLRLPGLIGLILSGVVIGPHGLNLIDRDNSIVLFGTIGLLYIMFLAGLDLDLNDFKKKRNKSIVFGLLTFLFPLGIGMVVCHYLLGYDFLASLLISSMFSTHTLVAYPIVTRLGISKNESVTITVGGTIITDTLVLLILAVITSAQKGDLNTSFFLRMLISLTGFVIIVFGVFPFIGRWFFKNNEGDKTLPYVFVLLLVFAAGFLSILSGLEPIIGAFMAGLAINRLIPHNSPLMNRIEFVGNAVFIPIFLISVGMIVDLKVLFNGFGALMIAMVLSLVALVGKWAAAYSTQKIYKYSVTQRKLIFGLSSTHAAATLAVILIGFQSKLIDVDVLNGTIILILITCLTGTYVTDKAGRKLVLEKHEEIPELNFAPQRILIPIANPATVERLMDLAVTIKDAKSPDPLFPLSVVKDDEEARDKVISSKKMLEKAIASSAANETTVQILTRVDASIVSGITRAVKEMTISILIMGWGGAFKSAERVFGSIFANIIDSTWQTILLCSIKQPLNTISRLLVLVPQNAEYEIGFTTWCKLVFKMANQINAPIEFHCSMVTSSYIQALANQLKTSGKIVFVAVDDAPDLSNTKISMGKNDLLVVVSAHSGTISHRPFMEAVPGILNKSYILKNFLLLIPEQSPLSAGSGVIPASDLHIAQIQNNIEKISRLRKSFFDVLKNFYHKLTNTP